MPLRLLLPGLLLAVGFVALSAPAAADPPPWAGQGKHREREWRQERWERHEARRGRRGGYDAPASAHAPPPVYVAPPAYAPLPSPVPGLGVFVPFR